MAELGGEPQKSGPALSAPVPLTAEHDLSAFAAVSQSIGAVMVHAKDDAARRFYLRCAEFIEYPQDSRTLFLPIETVMAAFDGEFG